MCTFAGSFYGRISLLDLEGVCQQSVVGVAGRRMSLLRLSHYQLLLLWLLPGPAARTPLLHSCWLRQLDFRLLILLPAAVVPGCDVVLAIVASSAILAMLLVSAQLLCVGFHCAGFPAVGELLHCVKK